MKTVKVRVSFDVTVELPDDADETFVVEENGCPGTGEVWLEVLRLIEAHAGAGTCLMCAADGENRILAVNGVPRGRLVDTTQT